MFSYYRMCSLTINSCGFSLGNSLALFRLGLVLGLFRLGIILGLLRFAHDEPCVRLGFYIGFNLGFNVGFNLGFGSGVDLNLKFILVYTQPFRAWGLEFVV